MHLEDYLQRHAQQQPDKIAAVSANQTISYGQLWQQVQQESRRYTPGVPVPFTTTQDINFLITYMAIHHAGAIAIPLPSMVPTGSICCDSLPPGLADILFTTGTTGTSKGVMISHKALMADAENLIEGQLFCNDLTFVISGPLNHIGSLSKIWPVITLGATLHILEGMKDLNAFFTALCSYPKTATFLVPANTRMILQLCPQRLAEVAPHIDFIESGAAPLPHSDMQELCRLLPHARLYNTYASTETGIITELAVRPHRCLLRQLPEGSEDRQREAASRRRHLLRERQAHGRCGRHAALRWRQGIWHQRQGRRSVEPHPLDQPESDQEHLRSRCQLRLSIPSEGITKSKAIA